MKRSGILFFMIFLALVSGWSQVIEIAPRLLHKYYVPNSYSGGIRIDTNAPMGAGDFPQKWSFHNGRFYIMQHSELITNSFDTRFNYLQTIRAKPPRIIDDNDHITVLDNMDVLFSKNGIINRFTMGGVLLSTYDLKEETPNEQENKVQFYNPVYANGNDGVIINENGQLKLVLSENGTLLKSDEEINDYVIKCLNSHAWLQSNKPIVKQIVNYIKNERGFIGKEMVSYNASQKIFDFIVKHFRGNGINLPVNDFEKYPKIILHPAERGFWIRAAENTDYNSTYIDRVYYIDLLADKVYLIKDKTPSMCYWFEAQKRAYTLVTENQAGEVLIEEYSLDFLAEISTSSKSSFINPKSILSSSLLTEKRDKNMYQPVKVLDGKPDTGWMENAKGPGIEEWIEIKFEKPITVDKLLISPGCFDKRYWTQNNRIKKLNIELDDYVHEAAFIDIMIPQEMKFPAAKTFSSAKFTVKDVYKTGKDDDTCISEIEFWNAGKKLEIDITAFADHMKVVPE